MRAWRWLSVAMICLLQACTAGVVRAADEEGPAVRIIVKPLHSIASGAALMQKIHAALPAERRLSYLREMSGGAHVLLVREPNAAKNVEALVEQLKATGLFEYVEADSMLTIRRP